MEILNLKLISPNNCKILYRGEHKFLSRLNDREIRLTYDFIKNFNIYSNLSFNGYVLEKQFQFISYPKQKLNLKVKLKNNKFDFDFISYSYCCFSNSYYQFSTTIYLEPEEKNIKNNKANIIDDIINSTVGLKNLGGTCSISSIIQILAHTNCFVHEFLKHYTKYKKISFLLYNLFMGLKSGNTSKQFSEFCNKLNSIIHVTEIDPMYFCTKFLEQLNKENPFILKLFCGKKKITFENLEGFDDEEEFLFNILHLSPHQKISRILFQNKKNIDNKEVIQRESYIEEPQILMINVQPELYSNNFSFEIPNQLKINKFNYKLYAVNQYDNYHSRV